MLRDRFDIITASFAAQEQKVSINADQPYGGVYQCSVNYPIAAIRVDNYTNRWLHLDSEGFVVPLFTHGFVINLFTQQQSVTFRSIKSPFGPPVNYSRDLNPKKVTSPFPSKVLVSLYDDVQPQLPPQSLVKLDNALIEAVEATSLTTDVQPIDTSATEQQNWPTGGTLLLPTLSIPVVFEDSARGTFSIGGRNVNLLVGGMVACAAGVWTTLPVADQPQTMWSRPSSRIKTAILSTDTVGLVDLRNQFGAGGSRGNMSMYLGAQRPEKIDFETVGWWIDYADNSLQVRHAVGGNVAYTIAYTTE